MASRPYCRGALLYQRLVLRLVFLPVFRVAFEGAFFAADFFAGLDFFAFLAPDFFEVLRLAFFCVLPELEPSSSPMNFSILSIMLGDFFAIGKPSSGTSG